MEDTKRIESRALYRHCKREKESVREREREMGVDWVLCLKTEQAEQRNKEYTRRERESKGELKKTGGEEERHVFFHNGYFFFR